MKDYFAKVQAIRAGTILYRFERRHPCDPDGGCVAYSEIATLNAIIRQMSGYRSDSGVLPDASLGSLWFPEGIDPSTLSSGDNLEQAE